MSLLQSAPRDPDKKRPYFFIMKDKQAFGYLQNEGEYAGRGVQFIYENDGRLQSSAKVAGNLNDQEILQLLETTEGLKKLVHSIGVSVETENPEDNVTFVFQMYGKTDMYGGGTILLLQLRGNGAEQRLCLAEADWSADDAVPGQIRFVFDTPGQIAKVQVRFFLNEGFEVIEPVEDDSVDFASAKYQRMIERSLIAAGNTAGIQRAIKRAKRGEHVTLAYIGGSVTQGAGATPINTECYAYRSWQAFAETYGVGENVHLIKAGVGGTPSELGMIRFERDVLRDGAVSPDIVVIEFAVNDAGDETKGICYESLVQKVLALPGKPAVVLLFAVFADDSNLQERFIPIGSHYGLPMVSIRDAVTPQFRFNPGEGRVVSKNQFFYDAFHPSNVGHQIMADCLTHLWEKSLCQEPEQEQYDILMQQPVIGNTFAAVKLLDRRDAYPGAQIECGSFDETDTNLQCVEMDDLLTTVPEFPFNWHYDGTSGKKSKAAFQMKINCRALLLIFKDSGDTDAGCAEVYVDGTWCLTANPHINGWIHCNPVILFSEEESNMHQVVIQMSEESWNKKFTILGFGYVV